ncbi:uncharacterized protein LOC124113634 [Haliotis rufescens]|uniref:uncharacterized protein LOC124113634 n=1 Tax=Haliotis rufescens TaxID=6454 RepID=UPI00201FAB4A|nr:uncharacterized protein LOC124113634 [Haliotis rufescens]
MGKPKIKVQRSQRKQRFSPRKITSRQDDAVNITIHSLREREPSISEDGSKRHSGVSNQPHKCPQGKGNTKVELKELPGQQRCKDVKVKLITTSSSLTSAQSSSRSFNDTYKEYVQKLRHVRPMKSEEGSSMSLSSGSNCVHLMTSDAVSGKRSSDDRDVEVEEEVSSPSRAVEDMETTPASPTNIQHKMCKNVSVSRQKKQSKKKPIISSKAQNKSSSKQSRTTTKVQNKNVKEYSRYCQQLPGISTVSSSYTTDQSVCRLARVDVLSEHSSDRILVARVPHQGCDSGVSLPESVISAREPARILLNKGRVPVADAGVQVQFDHMSPDFQVCVDVESSKRFIIENGPIEISSDKDLGGCKNSHLSDLVILELEKQKRNDVEKNRQPSGSNYVSNVRQPSENMDTDRSPTGSGENMDTDRRPTKSEDNLFIDRRPTGSEELVSSVGKISPCDLDSFLFSSSEFGSDVEAEDEPASKLTLPVLRSLHTEERSICVQTRLKARNKRRSSVTNIDQNLLNQQSRMKKPTRSVTRSSEFQAPSVSKRRRQSQKPGTSPLELTLDTPQKATSFEASCDKRENISRGLESSCCSSSVAPVDENTSEVESSSSCNSILELTSKSLKGKKDVPIIKSKGLLSTKHITETCSVSAVEVEKAEATSASTESVVPPLASPSTSTLSEGMASGLTELTGLDSLPRTEGSNSGCEGKGCSESALSCRAQQSVRKNQKQKVKKQRAWRKSKSVFNVCKLSDQLDECFSWSENSPEVSISSCKTLKLIKNTSTIEMDETECKISQNCTEWYSSGDELFLAETHLRNRESHDRKSVLQPVDDSALTKDTDDRALEVEEVSSPSHAMEDTETKPAFSTKTEHNMCKNVSVSRQKKTIISSKAQNKSSSNRIQNKNIKEWSKYCQNISTIDMDETECKISQNCTERYCSEDELFLAETHLRNRESHDRKSVLHCKPVVDSAMTKDADDLDTVVSCQESFDCDLSDRNGQDNKGDLNTDKTVSDIDIMPFNILDDTSDRMTVDSAAGNDDRCDLREDVTKEMAEPQDSNSSPSATVSPKIPPLNLNTASQVRVVQYSSSSSEEGGDLLYKTVQTKKKCFQLCQRGRSGWEDSLRQRPAKTQRYQVGQEKVKAAEMVSHTTRLAEKKGSSSSDCSDQKTNELIEVTESNQGKKMDDPPNNTKAPSKVKQDDVKEAEPKERPPPKKCHSSSKGSSQDSPSKKCNGSPKNKGPEAVVLETDEELAQVVEIEPDYGKLVWARLSGERWWPGTIVKGTLIYLQSQKSASSWVYWFGDHKVSQVSRDKIIPFPENYKAKVGNFKSKMYRKAVLEALAECCRRGGPHVNNNNDTQMLQWAEAGFPDSTTGRQVSLDPPEDCPLPDSMMGCLSEIGKDIRRKVASMSVSSKQPDDNRDNAVEAVRKGQKQLKDICISCSDLEQQVVCGHPLFEGGLCPGCKTEVTDTMYAVGDDGLHSFCAVCGAGGDLFVCDSPECKRVYCRPCVEELGGEDMLQQVIAASRWHCFLCSSCTDQPYCLLRPRPNSQEMIIRFFDTGYRVQMPSLAYFRTKRPLRVLSLFDGIGSGKLTLDQLGFSVDAYYASEIDADAIIVTRCNHGNSVVHVGDVTRLDHEKLAELSPIDLLIGGSPCNDVSLANPARRGFQSGSTALLFFEYVRVRDKLQQLNSNTHLFWLYENVASMKTEFKNTMSRFLECQPALWDSKYMSAQRRGRFFWGNIPGMYSTPAISTFMHENVDLNSVLERNCNRRATITKMGCVTTRTNSLKHGKHDELFPIEMEGETTGIWIPEVERLFGYPPHYTDVGNLPATRRQKLLGKSWSIPIMRNLLTPLRQYFTTTTTTTE